MEGKSVIGLGAAAAVGLWAFLSLTSTHDAERFTTRVEMQADKARFDRDFARQMGDKEGEAEAKARLVKAEEKLGRAEAEEAAKRELESVARDAVKVEAAPDAAKAVYREQIVKACMALGESEAECKQKGAAK